jgi:hypothetical protein
MTSVYPGITYVVPCCGEKLDRPAPARELYRGQMFRHTLERVERAAAMDVEDGRPARVLILSALHGLIELDTVLAPYDLKMGKPGSVTVEQLTEQALALGIDWSPAGSTDVVMFLPKAYRERLDAALKSLDVYAMDAYEATRGIGEQRRVNAHVALPTRSAPATLVDDVDGDGPTVWIGADAHGFWWGCRILVSYGRLRELQVLPVASAPWVCDSRGFNEIAEHGRWTIPAEQYVADLRRYAAEIGRMEWAAPQDWPAAAHLLAKTGLTEQEHQVRTIESVKTLRALAPELPIIAVVTGETLAGYLRHLAMYRAAGIDLRDEKLVVGVGALVKRPAAEAADIIRTLHAAGLKRLHGFGVKGEVLSLVGPLLESVDSASWSMEIRMRADGPCPHGLVKWERNCPVAAQQWAVQQRRRAATAVVQEALPLVFDMPSELLV